MPATERDFQQINETWPGSNVYPYTHPLVARAVRALLTVFRSKIVSGTEPEDYLRGWYLSDGNLRKAYKIEHTGSNLVFAKNTGTDNAPVWSTQLTIGISTGLVSGNFPPYYARTASEIAAAVTPTAYEYEPGDVRRYGANLSAASTPEYLANSVAVQAAFDSGHQVFFPNGTVRVGNNALFFNSEQRIVFESRDAVLLGARTGALLAGKNSGSTRLFNLQITSGQIENQRALAGGIGLDLYNVTGAKIFGTIITLVETGVRLGAPVGGACYYNEFYGVDITAVTNGITQTIRANNNQFHGGRVNDCTTGTSDDATSGNSYIGVAIEVFSTGHLVTGAAVNTRFWGSRLENAPTTGTGLDIGSSAQDTTYSGLHFIGLSVFVVDLGIRTNNFQSRIRRSVTRDVASFAAGEFRQEGPITVTGAAPGDVVSVTLPSSFPNNLMVGAPIVSATDTVFLPMHNPSGGAVDPVSGVYAFTVVKVN